MKCEVCHRLVDAFLWQLFPDGLQGDFLLISRLRLRLEITVDFQQSAPRRDGPAYSNLESLGSLILLSEAGTVRLVLRDDRTLRNGRSCLG